MVGKEQKVTVIEAGNAGVWEYFRELWTFRRLILALASRDIKIKYAQTALGLIWSIFQPLTWLLIFSFFFARIISVDTGGIPYPLFAFCGMISWYFFSYLVQGSGTALITEQELIQKIAFPRMSLLISKAIPGFIELLISLGILLIIMIVLSWIPGPQIILLPVFLILNALVGLSISFWLSALTIKNRDLLHVIPFLVNLGIWLTPVFYPATLIPEQYSFLIYLNPMAGVIAGFRWTLIGDVIPSVYYLAGIIPVFILFISGCKYFIHTENQIADYI